jgi:hypothetical protein
VTLGLFANSAIATRALQVAERQGWTGWISPLTTAKH